MIIIVVFSSFNFSMCNAIHRLSSPTQSVSRLAVSTWSPGVAGLYDAYNWMLSTYLYKKVKASSYIAQYPVLRTVQSALHFTFLTDLFTQTPSRLLWEASSHMLQLMREGCSYTYPPLSIVRYSFKQLSELEQCRVTKTCPRF